ncbi:hypothetical protein B0H11DRAFT_2351326 [Mycena galericulata]|nr:hypothetical protein B0H11DRAFT_2351326 [Mycena galericulata]
MVAQHQRRQSFKFRCHFCEPPSQLIRVTRSQPQKRVKKQADKPPRTSLAKRLLPGKGALARHGKYWYPVRLLFKKPGGWMVKWWRGNRFIDPQAPPSKVADSDLRDELWANPGARRQICVSFFIMPPVRPTYLITSAAAAEVMSVLAGSRTPKANALRPCARVVFPTPANYLAVGTGIAVDLCGSFVPVWLAVPAGSNFQLDIALYPRTLVSSTKEKPPSK